ncbi:hypothetical protein PG997_007518 [Apiospora hydei]|uniref:Heterokaryon incompatibility domain-containing protein n=1 Tax=Apiospora hydei TaxID=1337664 RepID=A0ABR1WB58_9PEZI
MESRGRAYDIWSIGCILLEYLVWATSGYDALRTFKNHTEFFWAQTMAPGQPQYTVHPYVGSYMQMTEQRLEENTAHKEILLLVRDSLLVLKDRRIRARDLSQGLETIRTKCYESPQSYPVPTQFKYPENELGSAYRPPHIPQTNEGMLAAPGQGGSHLRPQLDKRKPEDDSPMTLIVPKVKFDSGSGASMASENNQQSKSLNDSWKSSPDNKLASDFLSKVGWDRVKPVEPGNTPLLCSSCHAIKPSRLFERNCDLYAVQSKSEFCDLCSMLWHAVLETGARMPRWVIFQQDDGLIRIENGPVLLSLYSEPGDIPTRRYPTACTDLAHPGSALTQQARLGLPQLLRAGSAEQFTLLRQWTQACDSTHVMCRRHTDTSSSMPTRLLDVDSLKLVESASINPGRYVALSHCWGKLQDIQKFSATKANVESLKQQIALGQLPQNFRDAVMVTRGLGIMYLWIDSLCIIQDEEADWYWESARMEQVFSNAYCTIAASASRSSIEGFLGDRPARRCVQLQLPNEGTLYACLAIEDFNRDVERAPLSLRGWVLQERALSRRSIFFTSTQVYWECGSAVYCETLSKLQNTKSRFIGDANFPNFAMEYYRDGRQVLVQDLYERYSGLQFITMPTDRAIAILGLQERLARAFRTKAAYGMFSVYFARGLLWRRASVEPMTRIAWPPAHYVPTWSWLSKLGPIKYLPLEFEKVEWSLDDGFENPLKWLGKSRRVGVGPWDKTKPRDEVVLHGSVRKLLTLKGDHMRVKFDTEESDGLEGLHCMVVGRDKAGTFEDEAKHYVLVVYPLEGVNNGTFGRVGIATLRECHLGYEKRWVNIL